ncbi:MAG: efflux RND transporter permease subunit [Clostridia bacterium]|jgi:HAE1 family hydrophobic/amphiphilic exporter-1|nr:efflux RND transporter permease subunit [Clostridia bacterium]
MDKNNIPELNIEKNIFGKWANFFIEKYKVAFLLIFMLGIMGLMSFSVLPRELQPEVVLPYGYVMTPYPGASPEEVESLVTDKIEEKLEGLDKVKLISSYSAFGASMVFVEFEVDKDKDEITSDITEVLAGIERSLPDDAESPLISNIRTNNQPIMVINLAGNYDKVKLKEYAENIKRELERNKEIGEVDIIGGLEREIIVEVSPEVLNHYGISLDMIGAAVRNSNVNFAGGDIVLDEKRYSIRTVGEFEEVEDIGNVIVKYVDNKPLLLKDIAEVKDSYKEITSYSRLGQGYKDGKITVNDTIAITVRKKDKGDIIGAANKAHKTLDAIRGTAYPEDLTVSKSGELSTYIEDQLGAAVNNSKSGLLIVIVVLFLFIGFREALVVSLAIPMSIFISLILMHKTGMTFNVISLFALILAIGMLVDNGIVIMENIDRLRDKGLSPKEAAKVGTNQIAPAVASATLTTIAAFVPLFFTSGMMGEFIKDIPRTVIFAIGSSFFVAVTITPSISSKLLKGKKMKELRPVAKILSIVTVFILSLYAFADTETGMFTNLSWAFSVIFSGLMFMKLFMAKKGETDHFIIRRYEKFLGWVITKLWRKLLVIFTAIIALLLSFSLVLTGKLKVNMFSATDQKFLYVEIELVKGSKVSETLEITKQVEKILEKQTEVESIVSNVGITGADSLDSFTVGSGGEQNKARITVNLTEEDKRDITSIEIADSIRDDVKGIKGAKITVDELREGPPSGKPINIKFKGNDLDELKVTVKEATEVLKSIEGVIEVTNSVQSVYPEVKVKIDGLKAANYGLNDMNIAIAMRNWINGYEITKYRKNQEEIDVVVRLKGKELESVKDLEKLYFTNMAGQQIRFDQIGEIVESVSTSSISHEDGDRIVSMSSNLEDGYNAVEVTRQVREKLEEKELPEDIEVIYSGDFQDVQETFANMMANALIAVFLVYIILVVQFNSLGQPFMIIFTLFLALIGVMPGLYITGNEFGFVAFVGVVALVGIVVNDAIVLVDYANYLRREGYEMKEALLITGKSRFMPVMATTITTVGGILPLTLKDEFFEPLGYTLIFGLSVATMLTLIVIPTMYSFGRKGVIVSEENN